MYSPYIYIYICIYIYVYTYTYFTEPSSSRSSRVARPTDRHRPTARPTDRTARRRPVQVSSFAAVSPILELFGE